MNGRELYEQQRELHDAFGLDTLEWDDLTPVRRMVWELNARELMVKRLDDDAATRMTDEGGPPGEDH